jgi:hypothetical protein
MALSDRIAICISGQIRSGVENADSLLRYIGNLRDNVDIFIHTWDIETMSPHVVEHEDRKIRRKVDELEFKRIVEIYNPIDIRIDNFDIYQSVHQKRVKSREGCCHAQIPMFQSIWEVNQLKIRHEHLSNSKYNLVMRLRFDLDFGEGRFLTEDTNYIGVEKNVLYTVDFHNKLSNGYLEDICWISSSDIQDIVCSFAIERESKKITVIGKFIMQNFLPTEVLK